MTTTHRPAATTTRRLPIAVPAAIALAWTAAIAIHASGHADAVDHDALLGHSEQLSITSLAAYAAAWIAMVTAMMLPSAVPLLQVFAGASKNQPRPGLVLTVFVRATSQCSSASP